MSNGWHVSESVLIFVTQTIKYLEPASSKTNSFNNVNYVI